MQEHHLTPVVLRSELSHAGIPIRAGVHTGEVEMRGDDVSGIGVHIAARVAALAGAGELLMPFEQRHADAGAFTDAYRRYCWPVRSLADLKLAPFHLLATEGRAHPRDGTARACSEPRPRGEPRVLRSGAGTRSPLRT